MYTLQLNAPVWYCRPAAGWRRLVWPLRYGWLAWLARVTGVARRWEASGRDLVELGQDLRRVAALHDIAVEETADGFTLSTGGDKPSFLVSSGVA